jgi:DNA-binding transcriptional ArsR family regulator
MVLAPSRNCRREGMIKGAIIAEVAALVGDPARATMLSVLLDGRAMTASGLALAARITPQTASTHLGKLTKAGLLAMDRNGRHRYFRLATPKVAEMIEGIVAVALENRPRFSPISPQARAVDAARICYDHLAGRLSVDLTDALITREFIVIDDEAAAIHDRGYPFFQRVRDRASGAAFGSSSRVPTLPRLDRAPPTYRGSARGRYYPASFRSRLDREDERSHAVVVTPLGRRGLEETFGVDASEPTEHSKR